MGVNVSVTVPAARAFAIAAEPGAYVVQGSPAGFGLSDSIDVVHTPGPLETQTGRFRVRITTTTVVGWVVRGAIAGAVRELIHHYFEH